ncbi:hypothetical protein CCR95_11100 [Thiocystis minor]|nr:hypothetical protein [Thiocystis minor]
MGNRLLFMAPETDLNRPHGGDRQQREQPLNARGLSQMGVFEMKSMGFQGSEQRFNGPAHGVFRQRLVGIGVARDEQPLAILQALSAEIERVPPQPAGLAQHPSLLHAQILR